MRSTKISWFSTIDLRVFSVDDGLYSNVDYLLSIAMDPNSKRTVNALGPGRLPRRGLKRPAVSEGRA